jgi:hypothetical protein
MKGAAIETAVLHYIQIALSILSGWSRTLVKPILYLHILSDGAIELLARQTFSSPSIFALFTKYHRLTSLICQGHNWLGTCYTHMIAFKRVRWN